jgi:hypothetical protein
MRWLFVRVCLRSAFRYAFRGVPETVDPAARTFVPIHVIDLAAPRDYSVDGVRAHGWPTLDRTAIVLAPEAPK